jgi:hypothetical protein
LDRGGCGSWGEKRQWRLGALNVETGGSVNVKKAFIAGIIAGAVMVLIMAMTRALGSCADMPMMVGTMAGTGPSGAAWLMGFMVILLGAGIGGIAYAATFEALTHKADAMTGILVAIAPMAVEGLMLGFIDRMHPLMPKIMQSPGFFMSSYGIMGVIGFVASHLAFGAIVGSLYGPIEKKMTSNYTPMDE